MKLPKLVTLGKNKLVDRSGKELGGHKCDVLIGMPTYRYQIEADCHLSTVALMKYSTQRGRRIQVCQENSAVVAKARNDIIDEAYRLDAEWVLFIDSDMVFRPEYLEMLLAHNKDVVGGLCTQRVPPFFSTVYFLEPETDLFVCLDSADPNAVVLNSLIKCDGTGTAFLLIRRSVFDRIPKPYFAMPPTGWMRVVNAAQALTDGKGSIDDLKKELELNKTRDGITGEDLFFAKTLMNAGVEMYVDTGVMVGHVGQYPYTFLDRLSFVEANKTTGKVDESKSGADEDRVRSYAGAGVSALLRSARKAAAVPSVAG